MAHDPHSDAFEVYEDYEEFVDADEHERVKDYQPGAKTSTAYEADIYDEYRYGADSGEAYEDK